jgi:hypothetical protein
VIPRAFYSVADAAHFPGVAALLNSLRLLGHDEPFFLVDAGLTPQQRSRLARHVTMLDPPARVHAVFLAPYGPIEHPAEVAILLDADIVVVRPLGALAACAEAGRVVAFVNDPPNHHRFFPEWKDALGLGALRRRAYVNAGQLVIPDALARTFLPRWTEAQQRIGTARSRYGSATLGDPFYFADQDVLNALLAAYVPDEAIEILEHGLAPHPPFAGLRLEDILTLRCRYEDGTSPFLLHHIMTKPWLGATRTTIYSRLLTRLLLHSDVAVPLEPRELPMRLREGPLAATDRARSHGQAAMRAEARRQLGRFGIRTRARGWWRKWRAAGG